jgi:formylmethanofuran dehydrogenase subunit E
MSDPAKEHGNNNVACDRCGEAVPRPHTVLRSQHGRLCWFCNSELDELGEADWDEDDDYVYDDDWD